MAELNGEVWLDVEARRLADQAASSAGKPVSEWLSSAVSARAEFAEAERLKAIRLYGEMNWRDGARPRRAKSRGRERVRATIGSEMHALARREAELEGESLIVWLGETVRARAELEQGLLKQESEAAPLLIPLERTEAVRRGLGPAWDRLHSTD